MSCISHVISFSIMHKITTYVIQDIYMSQLLIIFLRFYIIGLLFTEPNIAAGIDYVLLSIAKPWYSKCIVSHQHAAVTVMRGVLERFNGFI